jgi:nitroreductase
MDVTTVIKERRSIRKYHRKAIPEKDLQEILEAARIAPSAANRQAWEMIVVTDPALKAELVPVCKNQRFIDECSAFLVAVEDPEQKWSKVDCTIMMDHVSLVAQAKGLGTCWIGAYDKDRLAALLGVPKNKAVAVAMTLGYPDESPEARTRKSASELFHWNKFGVRQ